MLVINLASALSVPIAGALADRLVRRHPAGRVIVQLLGLLVGAGFVVLYGQASTRVTLLASMAAFGICKGFYDSGIFASLYDTIEPRARGTAAGIMNTVGWLGGAIGTYAIGFASEHGRHASKIQNMSEAISFGGVLYILAAVMLIATIIITARQSRV